MFATMKIVGVPSDSIGQLHKIVNSPEFRTKNDITINSSGGTSTGRQKYVEIEESKFDGAHDTYTVTLKFYLNFLDQPGNYQTYQPVTVMRSVLQAIDPHLLCDTEQKIPTEKIVRQIRREEISKKIEEMEDGLVKAHNSLFQKQTQTSIKANGEVILNAGETYTELENRWCFMGDGISRLELPEQSSDPFVNVLIGMKKVVKEHDDLKKELESL